MSDLLNKVDISSDGTPEGTIITINGGKAVGVRSFLIQQSADEDWPTLVLSMLVDDLSYDGKTKVFRLCPTCKGSGKSPISGQVCSVCGGPGTMIVDPPSVPENKS